MKNVQDLANYLGIERRGRLAVEHHLWLHGARDRYALLLPSRKLVGVLAGLLGVRTFSRSSRAVRVASASLSPLAAPEPR